MPDDPIAGGTPAAGSAAATAGITALGTPVPTPAATPPAATPPVTPPAGTGAAGQVPAGEGEPKQYGEAYVAELRKEAAARRVREKELEKELNDLKQAGMTEAEKLTARLKQLEDDNRNAAWRARSGDIRAIAGELGCKKTDLIVKLVDDDVEDADLRKAVAQIKKDNPELFLNAIGSADGGSGGGAGSGAGNTAGEDMNSLIRRAAGRG